MGTSGENPERSSLALPGVSVIIPTLNAARILPRCLRSVRDQDYPPALLDILIMDGGSSDDTVEVAGRFGCTVTDNPRKRAEPGVALGMACARQEIKVVMAADNELPTRDWIARMVDALQRSGVRGAFTHVTSAPDDPPFCRYFNRLHADPFNWFVYRAAANPRRFGEVFPVCAQEPGYTVFEMGGNPRPLLALAQGFTLNGELLRAEDDMEDDITPVWDLLDRGEVLAYVDAGIFHHTVESLDDFLAKYYRRALAAFRSPGAAGYLSRQRRMSRKQRLRQLLWLPYCLSVVPPAVDALLGIRRDQDLVWIYHPVACLGLGLVIIGAAARARLGDAIKLMTGLANQRLLCRPMTSRYTAT